MNQSIKLLSESVKKLSDAIIAGTSDNRTLNEIFGWNCPSLTRYDLSDVALDIMYRLDSLENIKLSTDYINIEQIQNAPQRIDRFIDFTLPQMYNGNCSQAYPNYIALIQWINTLLEPLFSWEAIKDNKLLPKTLTNRLRVIESEMDELVPEKEKLQEQVKLIQDATQVAEDLPTTLTDLKDANKKVQKLEKDSEYLYKSIHDTENVTKLILKDIEKYKGDAEELIKRCEQAFGLATTVGLAASFEKRAKILGWSITTWTVVLLSALGGGAYIGQERFTAVNKALANDTSSGHIWILISLSVLSLGAPIWLAWLATKQIGQRFKLSEDYAFKASVAKAYQGYKAEAKEMDPEMLNRLFASALTRFDELPIRLMDNETHGSPWQELLNNPGIMKRIKEKPELLEKLLDYLFNMMKKTSQTEGGKTPETDE